MRIALISALIPKIMPLCFGRQHSEGRTLPKNWNEVEKIKKFEVGWAGQSVLIVVGLNMKI